MLDKLNQSIKLLETLPSNTEARSAYSVLNDTADFIKFDLNVVLDNLREIKSGLEKKNDTGCNQCRSNTLI